MIDYEKRAMIEAEDNIKPTEVLALTCIMNDMATPMSSISKRLVLKGH